MGTTHSFRTCRYLQIYSYFNITQNTVLLNANVAFLAIQSIDNASTNPGRSPAQIASFLSIVASFGSIILGLVLARKHRAKASDTASDAVCPALDLGRFMILIDN